MSTLDKKYYHNIDLDSNELKSGRVYNLTTIQKNALSSSLTATDKGYIVYDITALSLYIWDGSGWTTAAGGSGTVTSVAALTLGTTGTDLSSTVANGTTTPVITLNVPTASSTNRGVLSSADWTIFNGKQSALSGTGLVKSTAGTISYITDNSSNWNTAYTDRNKWDGGATGLVAATGRTSLGLGTFAVVSYPTWTSGTPFVKMTAAGTFGLDTATYLTSVTATSPITSSGGNTPIISTSMSANKLIGRSTAGIGVMEEISIGTGLSLSAGTLSNTATYTSPLTTKGDIFVRSTVDTSLPVGLNTQVLIADSSTPTGLKWGSNTAATPTGYYGAWQDNITQTAAASNTGYAMIFRTIDLSNGVSVVTNGTNLTRITFANTGIYNLQFSSQFQNTHTSDEDVTIWLRFNGTDVTGSAGLVSVPSKHGGVNGHIIAGWNYLLDVVAGQYYELVWSTSNTLVTMEFYAAGSPPPSAASVIMTVTQQSGIMAGTGVTGLGTSGNIQTGTTQTLATGTSGTAFNIASSGNTQTFNIPLASTASVTAGLISKTDYDTFTNKQANITGAATTITSSNLTVSKALVSDTSGKVATSTVSSVELSYVAGVTSAIQTQLDGKLSTISGIAASGNLTGTYPSPTIANGVVSLAKMANLTAYTIIGNDTGTSATPSALSGDQVTAMLNTFSTTVKGLVPAATSGALPYLFLASDGTWVKIGTSAIADQSSKTLIANTSASPGAVSAVAISSITTELTAVVGDSGSGGTKGLVPAPASGDASAGKFLKADGLWAVPTTTIGTNVVTNSMLAQVATAIFKGRTTAGAGNVEDLTVTQATAMLDTFTSSLKGLAPASSGGTTNFLRADGTWAVPAGGGGGGTTTNPFVIKADSGTTEGTDLYTFNGSTAKTINIVAGTNITITKTSGTLTVSSTAGSTPSSYNYIMSTYFS